MIGTSGEAEGTGSVFGAGDDVQPCGPGRSMTCLQKPSLGTSGQRVKCTVLSYIDTNSKEGFFLPFIWFFSEDGEGSLLPVVVLGGGGYSGGLLPQTVPFTLVNLCSPAYTIVSEAATGYRIVSWGPSYLDI